MLDSLLTLLIFIPVLLEVGSRAQPDFGLLDYDAWLVVIAVTAAFGGLWVSMCVGRRLVLLEVQNQKVEGLLRTNLVVLEQTPALIVGSELSDADADADDDGVDPDEFTNVSQRPPRPRAVTPAPFFNGVIRELWRNYRGLFANFAAFNTWISAYDQIMIIVPYVLAAPLMFARDPARRITLGTLMQVSNAFDKVFGAMAVVSENWAAVNDFRSTVVRLREFERHVYHRKRFDHTLLRDCDLTTPHEVFGIPRLSEGTPPAQTHIVVELAEPEPKPGEPPRSPNGACARNRERPRRRVSRTVRLYTCACVTVTTAWSFRSSASAGAPSPPRWREPPPAVRSARRPRPSTRAAEGRCATRWC